MAEPIKLSVRQAASEFKVTHTKLFGLLKAAGIQTGRGIKISILDAHRALTEDTQDINKAMARAKLKNLEEEGQLKEIERRLKQNEVVLLSEVNDLMIKVWNPVARSLKDMDAKLAPKCNPSDQVLAREELGKFKRKICKDIERRCSRLKK